MTYLITGVAGFIGFHVAKELMRQGHKVVGFDNLNEYYDPRLKQVRLKLLKECPQFVFEKIDLLEKSKIYEFWSQHKPNVIIHLAAQAGVRYSIENPETYLNSNIIGFQNMVDIARELKPENLVYASSSSVYGLDNVAPYAENQALLSPASYYAATKIANEVVAGSYSAIYGLNMVGLRFFTVYGPFGRPDMALYKFSKLMMNNKSIDVYNDGNLSRDWTFIDDIVAGIVSSAKLRQKHTVFNLGKGNPDKLMDAISYLESDLNIVAQKKFKPMQQGDVYFTHADISKSQRELGYNPSTPLKEGIHKLVSWIKEYKEFFYD